MSNQEVVELDVVMLQRNHTALDAAKLMREYCMTNIPVMDECDGVQTQVGKITEHDLVVEVMAPELDSMVITVGDIIDLRTQ